MKKKKAEEEARKKAEEEQARRDAAEAEVRRMEQEVEERKRKAEEERKALEEAEKAPKIVKPSAGGTAGKKSLPMPAMIGAAAAVVIVILIAVFALGGKGKKGGGMDAEKAASLLEADFKAEYETKEEGYDLKLFYPEEYYAEVTEESKDNILAIHFEPSDKGAVPIDIMAAKMEADGEALTKSTLALFPSDKLVKGLSEVAKAAAGGEGITVSNEKYTDLTAETPEKYYYSCDIALEGDDKGSSYSWIRPGSDDSFLLMTVKGHGAGDAESIKALCDKFVEKNEGDVLKVPGANPPTSQEIEGILSIDGMHMGIHMPEGQFTRVQELHDDNADVFCDDNGALILVAYEEADVDFDTAALIRDDINSMYKSMAESGINDFYPYVDSRMFLDEAYDSMNHKEYYANYKDSIGSIPYWEGFYACHWRDLRTQKYYFYEIIMLAPEVNKDTYQTLFKKSLDRLDDI